MTQEHIELITKLYEEGLSARALRQYVPYTEHTILKYLRANGVNIRSKAGYRPPFNEHYFETIDTERKAYFLGYLMADGNVSERKNSQPAIRMELNCRDATILQTLKEEWQTNIEIKETRKNCCILRVHSQIMFDDLTKYGVIPKKTGREIFPIKMIPDDLIHHFIRGFFDGDGWSTVTHHGNRPLTINMGFCGNRIMLEELRNYFTQILGCYPIKVGERLKHGEKSKIPLAQMVYGSRKDNLALYHFMYDDATIFLERKRNKFIQFLPENTERA